MRSHAPHLEVSVLLAPALICFLKMAFVSSFLRDHCASARPPSAEESGRLAADAATEDDGDDDGLLATVGVRACVRRLIARALGFALVSSLQAEARTT